MKYLIEIQVDNGPDDEQIIEADSCVDAWEKCEKPLANWDRYDSTQKFTDDGTQAMAMRKNGPFGDMAFITPCDALSKSRRERLLEQISVSNQVTLNSDDVRAVCNGIVKVAIEEEGIGGNIKKCVFCGSNQLADGGTWIIHWGDCLFNTALRLLAEIEKGGG